MIIITGDVHSNIKDHWEQEKKGSEIACAEKYLKILKKHNLSSTLFINGICIDKEQDSVKNLLKYDVELGGHTYDNFGSMSILKSYYRRKIYKGLYGSESQQRKDIIKTKSAFEKLNLKMTSWRTHAFASNKDTFKILKENGVKYVSDFFTKEPFEELGIIHVPINTPPDNNALAYGPMVPENRDLFIGCTKGRITSSEWLEILKKRVMENEKSKKISILLIHPITMAVLDDFKSFEELCKFLSKYQSLKMSELKI